MHTSKSVVNVLVFCLLCTSAGFGSTAIEKMLFPDSKLIKFFTTQKKKIGLSNAASLEWKKVSSSTYTFNNGLSTDASLKKRDTITYNSDGTIKLYKSSKATSGWEVDSLINSDSIEIINANEYEMYSYSYALGKISTGMKYEYRYLDNKKCIVSIINSLDLKTMTWVPVIKDSIVLTESYDYVKCLLENTINDYEYDKQIMPDNGIFGYSFDKNVSASRFEYNTTSKHWILNSTTNYLNDLKTPISITCEIKQGLSTGGIAPKRSTFNFKSNNYAYTNLSGIVMYQLKPDQTGYDSLYIIAVDFKSGDYFKYQWTVWDDTTKRWNIDFYNLDCKLDSYNNDTSSLVNGLLSSAGKTIEKTKRSYDANGNNIESIVSSGTNESNLKLSEKTVMTYAQIDVPVKRNRAITPVNNVIVTYSNNIIAISAPSVTEIALYNGSGRLIQSRKQVGSDVLSLDIKNIQQPISSGVYFARVKYAGKWTDFKLNINK